MGYFNRNSREVPPSRLRYHGLLCSDDTGHQAQPAYPYCPNFFAVQEKNTRHLRSWWSAYRVLHRFPHLESQDMLASRRVLAEGLQQMSEPDSNHHR